MSKLAKLGSGVRFKKLANKMAREGVSDPDAAAAAVGREKYGNAKMNKMSIAGKAKKDKKI